VRTLLLVAVILLAVGGIESIVQGILMELRRR